MAFNFEPFTTLDALPEDAEPILQSSGGDIVIYAQVNDLATMPLPLDVTVLVESPEGIIAVPLGSAFARGQWVDIESDQPEQAIEQPSEQ